MTENENRAKMDSDDDEDDQSQEHASSHKMVSKHHLTALADACKRLVREKFKYEPEYYKVTLDMDDTDHMKLYMMRVVDSRKSDSSKNITVYVSSSQQAVSHRISLHNKPDSHTRDTRTKCNATRWKFCFCVYIPLNLRRHFKERMDGDEKSITRMMRRYWSASHGVRGKLARGLTIANMFGLRYTFSDEMENKIEDTKKKLPPELQCPSEAFK